MMAAWNKHAGIIITLLAFLAPMACHGFVGLPLVIYFPILCDRGWVPPIILGPVMICPRGSETSLPLPSPSSCLKKPAPPSGAGLYFDYYNSTHSNDRNCSNAEAIVRKVVEEAIASRVDGRGIAAGLIRLHFHDCFVRGCDASVLLTTTASGNNDTELEGLPNKDSLRGMDVIDKAKSELEAVCPEKVSCADILAFASRDAARSLSGGKIDYRAEGGRWDGRESFANETDALPSPFSNLMDIEDKFCEQGLNETDLVALSGCHSIGRARCGFISNSPGMNQTLVQQKNPECRPTNTNPNPRVNQDNKTPDVLDTKYYENVDDGNALFNSDYALANSSATKALVEEYKANSGNVWEKAFAESTIKMGRIHVTTKPTKGFEIRLRCSTVNPPRIAPSPSPA